MCHVTRFLCGSACRLVYVSMDLECAMMIDATSSFVYYKGFMEGCTITLQLCAHTLKPCRKGVVIVSAYDMQSAVINYRPTRNVIALDGGASSNSSVWSLLIRASDVWRKRYRNARQHWLRRTVEIGPRSVI